MGVLTIQRGIEEGPWKGRGAAGGTLEKREYGRTYREVQNLVLAEELQ